MTIIQMKGKLTVHQVYTPMITLYCLFCYLLL